MIKKRKGQSLVEFALVLPIMMFLIMGMIDFGRILYTSINLNLLNQEAVRVGSFNHNDEEIETYINDHFSFGDEDLLSIDIDPPGARDSGDYVTITLSYPVNSITPIMSRIIPNPFIVKTDSTIRIE